MKFAEGSREGVEGKVRGMHGLMAKAADRGHQFIALECTGALDTLADDHLGQARAAGDRRHAALSPILSVGDGSSRDFESEDHDIAAGGILDRDPNVGSLKFTHVARMFEMVEEYGTIHWTQF